MKKKWLLLESNSEQAKQMQEFVKDNIPGVDLLYADNIKDAYEIIFEHTVDLFIVNMILDEKDKTDISGIHFIRNVRDIVRYIFTPVIYVTTLTDHEFSVYKDPNCMGYVRIPYRESEMKKILIDALQFKTPRKNRDVLYMRNDTGIYSIKVEDVLYIEFTDEAAEIHTVNRNVEKVEYRLCKQSLAELDSMDLVQCSKSVIVNCFFVKDVDKTNRIVSLRGDDIELAMGPSYIKNVCDRVYR